MYIKALCISLTVLSLSFSSVAQADTYDYCDVLHKSLLFYEAQRSGRLPSSNRVPWRQNSALRDCTSILCLFLPNGDGNLEGGYYDAGDGVKFMFPQAFSATTLAWGFIEFKSAIDACGETQNYLDAIKWATDFIVKAHTSELEFWGQMGNGGMDHSFWGAPELMTMLRPTYKITSSNPGTELALEAASALAAASIAFKATNPNYSSNLVTHARQLYRLGYNYRGFYHDSIPDAGNYYKSYGYNDELVWGSTWLYRATGENAYLVAAKSDYITYNMKYSAPGQSFDWDQKAPGVVVNMWKATGDVQYLNDAQTWMNSWYPGNGITYTPGGLAWLREWGPLRYTAGSAFLGLILADSRSNSWAKNQVDYMLGSNPSRRSYVCGFGNNPPVNPHHRAAHGSPNFDINNPATNRHILTGALVGGPGKDDSYADLRTDYVKNEVAIDYNAAFTGALAGLAKLLGPSTVPTTTTTTPAPSTTTAAPPISQATVRPTTTTPTTTTAAPSTPSTTTPSTTTPTTPSTAGKVSIQLNSGSNVWWLGVAVLGGVVETDKVEFTDAGTYTTFTTLVETNWGYFIFSPIGQLKLPISLRVTSTTGSTLILTNIINSFTLFSPIATTKQYGSSTTRSMIDDVDARTRAINSTPVNARSLKLKVHQGSSTWWLAVALYDAIEVTSSVELKDATGMALPLRDGHWGYWLLETNGIPLALPLTITTTSASASTVSFTITHFSKEGLAIDSGIQY